MFVYLIMTVICCGFAFLAQKDTTTSFSIARLRINKATFYICCAAAPLILVSGLRWNVGVDHTNYYYIFTNILYELNTHVEIGFKLLCRAILLFTEDMSVMFFVCAIITVAFTMIAIRRNSKNLFISTFLYLSMGFFYYSMNSIRHYIALALYLFAFEYLRKRKLLRYIIIILIAASFHKIALIALPLYFLLNIRFKYYWYAIFAGTLGVVAITHRHILDFIYQFVFDFYKKYEAINVGYSYLNIGITLALSIMAFLYRRKLLEKNQSNIILINSAYLGFLFFALCGWLPVYTRIGQYLTILSLFLIPEIIHCEQNKKLKLFYTISLLGGFFVFMVVILLNARDPLIALLPYQSIFSR